MKRKIIGILIAVSLIASYGFFGADAEENNITVIYDGQVVAFDVQPQMYSDRVLVPMRAIFEQFGAKVKWDGDTQTITAKKKSKTIIMTVGSTEITKNDETYSCDAAPIEVDGRTLVPIRAISELLGLDVEWDENSSTVKITTSEDDDDESWKENIGTINLDSLNVTGDGISVTDNVITITTGGDFTVSGSLENGQIVIDSESKVKLRLSGMSLTNPNGAAIYVKSADKAYITITDGTKNYLADGEAYTTADEKEKACITARDNLEIKGNGSLTVQGRYGHGIDGSDSIKIENGNITITAKNDGIHVNDTLQIIGGTLNITADGDGLQSDEIVDITGGTINITTTGEIAAETAAGFNGMDFGGRDADGERQQMTEEERQAMREEMQKQFEAAKAQEIEEDNSDDVTSKGIKADWMLDISGGDVTVNSTDHSIHCKSDINIKGGTINLTSEAKKGISAHGDVVIDDGNITINKSTEGIESKQILTINGGNINITSGDDGLNAGGNGMDDMFGGRGFDRMFDQNSNYSDDGQQMQDPNVRGGNQMMQPGMQGGEQMMQPGMGGRGQTMQQDIPGGDGFTPSDTQENGQMGGGPGRGMESNEIDSEHHIQINGGNIYINAQGDGIDSNGSLVIDGGTVIVDGPTGGGDSALDSDGAIMVNGGELIAVGAAGMVEAPNSYSAQNVLNYTLSAGAEAGKTIEIKNSNGETIISYAPAKSYQSVICSSPNLITGGEYTVYLGGEAQETFTVTDIVTNIGSAERGFGGFGGRGDMGKGAERNEYERQN